MVRRRLLRVYQCALERRATIQEIVEYSKSEEAAKNAEERRQVMELLNHAVRAELAVLHEQDAAYVDDLLKQVEALMKKLKQEEESSILNVSLHKQLAASSTSDVTARGQTTEENARVRMAVPPLRIGNFRSP
jgi:dsDNA-specific endonuclease/ATPase MutS2